MALLIIAGPGISSYLTGAESWGRGEEGTSWGLYVTEHFLSTVRILSKGNRKQFRVINGRFFLVGNLCYLLIKKNYAWGYPGGTVVKNPPANAGDTGSSPGLGTSHVPRSN